MRILIMVELKIWLFSSMHWVEIYVKTNPRVGQILTHRSPSLWILASVFWFQTENTSSSLGWKWRNRSTYSLNNLSIKPVSSAVHTHILLLDNVKNLGSLIVIVCLHWKSIADVYLFLSKIDIATQFVHTKIERYAHVRCQAAVYVQLQTSITISQRDWDFGAIHKILGIS